MTWNTENSEIIGINGGYVNTGTVLVYIPLTGTIDENTSTHPNNSFLGNGKVSRVLCFEIMTDSVMGSTVIGIVDGGVEVGTKTVNINATDTLFKVDFTEGMDSGTNEFSDRVRISVNPATGGSSQNFSVVIERGLF